MASSPLRGDSGWAQQIGYGAQAASAAAAAAADCTLCDLTFLIPLAFVRRCHLAEECIDACRSRRQRRSDLVCIGVERCRTAEDEGALSSPLTACKLQQSEPVLCLSVTTQSRMVNVSLIV